MLGSALSRAAARAMLEAREMSDSRDGIVGLAEAIQAGRMRAAAALSGVKFVQESIRVRRPDCLVERIRQGRERVKRARGPETLA